jgi:hypothetical protein
MRCTLTSPPAVEPIDLPTAKLHLRVEITDDDALISALITAARQYCEAALKQALITQGWTLYLDSFPSAGGYYNKAVRDVWSSLCAMPSGLGFYPGMVPNASGVVPIPKPPIQAITAVQYYDFSGTLQTVPPASYNASIGTPGRIQPAYAKVWPIAQPRIDSVQIQFTAGYGPTGASVPANIQQAMLLCIGHWYQNREWVSTEGSFLTVPNTVDLLLGASEHGAYA